MTFLYLFTSIRYTSLSIVHCTAINSKPPRYHQNHFN